MYPVCTARNQRSLAFWSMISSISALIYAMNIREHGSGFQEA